jgi:hypothetical protein
MTRETLIKAIAAALANARGARHGMPPVTNVLEALKSVGGGKLIAEVTEDAESALSALEVAGAVVVPREPTDAMKQAAAAYRIEEAATGWDATAADVWKDMIAASPYRKPDADPR